MNIKCFKWTNVSLILNRWCSKENWINMFKIPIIFRPIQIWKSWQSIIFVRIYLCHEIYISFVITQQMIGHIFVMRPITWKMILSSLIEMCKVVSASFLFFMNFILFLYLFMISKIFSYINRNFLKKMI